MTLLIELPDDITESLAERFGDLPRHVVETLAVEGYRANVLTEFQLKVMLGYQTRPQVHQFLKEHGVPLSYTADDLRDDLTRLERIAL